MIKVFTDKEGSPEWQLEGEDQNRPFIELPDDTDLGGKKIVGGELVDKTDEDIAYEKKVRDFKAVYAARMAEYPAITDQLDMIYHNLNGWRATIKKVKDKHPLPDDLPPDFDLSELSQF